MIQRKSNFGFCVSAAEEVGYLIGSDTKKGQSIKERVCKKVKRASVVDGIQGAPCDAIPWEWGAGEPTYVNKGANKNSKVGIILTACLSSSFLVSFSLFWY